MTALRRWLRRSALFGLIAVAAIALAWWLGNGRAAAWLAERAEKALGESLHLPVDIEGARLALLPPSLDVARFSIGRDGEVARAEDVTVRLDVPGSLRRVRPSAALSLANVFVDVPRLAAAATSQAEEGAEPSPRARALPPLAVRVTVDGARVVVGERRTLAVGALAARASAGPHVGLRLNARGSDLVAENEGRKAVVDEVEVEGGWRRGRWRIQRGLARGPALDLRISGEREPLRHVVDLKGNLQKLTSLLDPKWSATGNLSAHFDLTGDLADPQGDGNVRVDDASFAGVAVRRLEASARRADGRVSIPSLRAIFERGEVSLEGGLREKGDLPLHAVLEARGFDTRDLQPITGELRHAVAEVDARLEVDAALRTRSGKLRGSGELRAPGVAPMSWSTSIDATEAGEALQLEVTQKSGSQITARAKVGDGDALSGEVHATLPDLAPIGELLAAVAPPAVLPTAGSAVIDATLGGTLSRPVVDARVAGRDLVVYEGNVEALTATLLVDAHELVVDRAEIRLPDGQVEAAGTFALTGDGANDWRAQGRGVDTDWLLSLLASVEVIPPIPVRGSATASVRASGSWDDVAIGGSAHMEDGVLAGEPVHDVRVTFDVREGGWTVDGALSGEEGARLAAQVGNAGAEGIRLSVNGEGWQVAKLAVLSDLPLSGVASLRADFRGPPGGLSGGATLHVTQLLAEDAQLGDVDVRAEARDGAWQLEGDALDGALRANAAIGAGAELPLDLEAQWREVDVAPLLGLRDLSAVVTGTLQADGPLRAIEQIEARVELSSARLSGGGETLQSAAPIRARLARGEVALEPFDLTGAGTRVQGEGRVERDGSLRLDLQGNLSLAWAEAVLAPLESAVGDVRLNLQIARSAQGDFDMDGEVRLDDGALDFGGVAAFANVDAVITLHNDVAEVKTLRAEVGGGEVQVQGVVDAERGPDLSWSMRQVALQPARSLEMELRGDGTLRGPWNRVVLAGDVTVVQLLYDRDLEFADLIPSFNRALKPAPNGDDSRPPIRLDLAIKARDSLYIENNIARVEAAADLHLGGTVRSPRVDGEVHVIDGLVRLRGHEFEIINGSLTFRRTLRNVAAIDFKAETVIDTSEESYGVGVRVSGYTNDYRVILSSSDGSLSPTDVASLITFGKTVSQLQSGGSGGGGGVSMDTLIGLAGNNLGGRLAGEAEHVLPFDKIEFRPQFSTTSGEFAPEVRVGKFLSEDLSAWIGQTFGVQSRTTVEGEYRLSDRVSAALSWESQTSSEQGALGGEIRFRRDFWRLGQLLFFGLGR